MSEVVEIPAEAAAASAPAAPKKAKKKGPPRFTQAPRVLIVDDDALFIRTFRREMRRYLPEVDGVETAREMFALLDGGAQYDVIILDVHLRDMIAPEVQRQMTLRACPISTVAMSAIATPQLIEDCRVFGAFSFHSKFFSDHDKKIALVIDLERAAAMSLERRFHAKGAPAASKGKGDSAMKPLAVHKNDIAARHSRASIMVMLHDQSGNVGQAASKYGINERNLRRTMRSLRLDPDLFRAPGDRYRPEPPENP